MTAQDTQTLIRETMTSEIAMAFDSHNDADYALSVSTVGRFRVNASARGARRPASFGWPATSHRRCCPVGQLVLELRGLVTGPTGPGKTTTFAAMIHTVKREPRRAHPDRRGTGHFVMSTLHTPDAQETVMRVIDFFAPHEQKQVRLALATSLRGIICQHLVPRADGEGRVVMMEIAVTTPRQAEAIADPDKTDTITDIIATVGYSGMQAFDQHLVRLVIEGVEIQAAKLVSSNAHDFSVMLKRAGIDPALVDADTPM